MGTLKCTFTRLKSFVTKNTESPDNSSSPSYPINNITEKFTEWDRNYIEKILNHATIRKLLQKIADQYYGSQIDDILLSGTEINIDNYPRVYAVYTRCCNKLGINQHPLIYVSSSLSGINALSVEIKHKKMILVSRRVTMLPEDELSFILGHELGHHLQGNLVCHTLNGLLDNMKNLNKTFGRTLPDGIEIPLKKWYRAAEYKADQTGCLCCGDLQSIESLFCKIIPYEINTPTDEYRELLYSHPLLSARLNEIRNFIKLQEI